MGFIIAFENNKLLGGYGDRIVGLISTKMIADKLNRDFYILWTKENVKKYINYEKYDYELQSSRESPQCILDIIDSQQKYKETLMNSENPFPHSSYKLYLNHEISQYLYANPKYKSETFVDDIYRVYSTLYIDILKPSSISELIVNSLISNDCNTIIGIQIRAGDAYMVTNPGESYRAINNPEENINAIFKNIKNHANNAFGENNYHVFITSDYENVFNLGCNVWDAKNIIYFNEKVQHLDRRNAGEFSKFYIDNYVLSQKTNQLYISDYSNYGRIAALSAKHSNIYSLNCHQLEKKSLLSKQEMIW
jgi:hypothetical protein